MKNILLLALILVAVIKLNAQLLISADSIPVRVSYFNIEKNNNKTLLNWKVVCYLQYANFELQRSANGTDYTTINNFTADRIRCLSPFDFEDKTSKGHVYYRLKVGDIDGAFSTSKVLVAFGKEKSFEINSITPNLVTASALLSISSAENDKAYILVTNYQGQIVKRLTTSINKGLTDVKMDLSELSAGMYLIRVTNSFLNVRTARFAKL